MPPDCWTLYLGLANELIQESPIESEIMRVGKFIPPEKNAFIDS